MKNTVLIIEDNEQNLYLTTFLLERAGFNVISAMNGPEGISMAVKFRPDLILLDIQLPQVDGYTVARELRKNVSLNSVPIIAVTSYAMTGDRERALKAGCTGYIEKPINPNTFISQVTEYLTKRLMKPEETNDDHSDC